MNVFVYIALLLTLIAIISIVLAFIVIYIDTIKTTKHATKLLSDLAAFNKLDNITVDLISNIYKINAKEICRRKGITYFIRTKS